MGYQLHDSQINALFIHEDKIALAFSRGFWKTDANGKEIEQMQNCKLIFHIEKDESLSMEDYSTIRVSKKGGVYKTIALHTFIGLLKKSAFDVDMEYDCAFSNRKMLQLYSNALKTRVELFVKEIKHMEYVHD